MNESPVVSASPGSTQSQSPVGTQPIPKKSLQIRTDKPRPHICSICTRAFARLEHLKRHERSHTNEKPFQCAACGRCFARRDLVLRHQQKLHSHVTRRDSVGPELKPGAPDVDEFTSTDQIIVLHNNTHPKAPLPDSSTSPPNFSSQSSPGTHTQRPPSLSSQRHTIPSPNTSSSINTPSNGRRPSQNAQNALEVTQQPSPATGDSPDLKDKKKPFWNPSLAADPSLQPHELPHQSRQQQQSQLRHTSFSAVSGVSYTNLKDALSIEAHPFPDAPPQVGFATPQLTAAEIDSKGLSTLDFGSLVNDWYLDDDRKPENGKSDAKFSSSLNTIPSESHLAEKSKDIDSSFISSRYQNFFNPNHPHYLRGTTPLALGSTETPSGYFEDHFAEIPPNHVTPAPPQNPAPSSSLFEMVNDLATFDHLKDTKKKSPLKKQQPSSVALNNDFKRARLGFSNDTDNLDWVNEIMAIPIQNDFPSASHDTGFVGMPYLSNDHRSDEMLSLFKHRQDSLVRQRSLLDASKPFKEPVPMSRNNSKVQFTIGESQSQNFVTEELRNRIILASNLSDAQFPPLDDLNAYTNLYETEFNAYFPFIHMPSLRNPMVDNYENIPLILSMCAIGALYSYHDSNTLLLFNLSKYHIHNFFDKEVTVDKLQFKKVPLMAHQSLVLHIFISIFLNEPDMVEITSKQINSMVGLIRSTNFHKPLEQFLVPPPPVKSENDLGIIQNNFDYFIMAQTRIRTIHCFYELETIRSILLGYSLPMNKDEVLNGTCCADERLFQAENAREWFSYYQSQPNKDLVSFTNNEILGDLYDCLCRQVPINKPLPVNTLFSLLMCVHESILTERKACKDKFSWRLNSRPKLWRILRAWEAEYAKNGGPFIINENNHNVLRTTKNIQVVLALALLAKIRLCLDVTSTAQQVVLKDWGSMVQQLDELKEDPETLKEAARYAKEILDIWLHNISSLDSAKTVSVRTPVFFMSCVFFGVLVMANTLRYLEKTPLSDSDKVFWLQAADILTRINQILSYSEESNSYSEFLRRSSNGTFDDVLAERYTHRLQQTVEKVRHNDPNSETEIHNGNLSIQTLSLGVRIFADAPLWPIAMGFAEALKNTACYFSKT